MFTHHKQSGKQHYREIKGQKEKFFRPFDKFFRPFNFPKRRFVKVLINNRISKYYLKQSETVMDKIPLTLACFFSLFLLFGLCFSATAERLSVGFFRALAEVGK